jgi:hypothetical protein
VHAPADRLHDHRRGQVARHGSEGLDAEDDHEDRRHQRTAAHPGEADDEADQEAGEGDERVEVHGTGGRT